MTTIDPNRASRSRIASLREFHGLPPIKLQDVLIRDEVSSVSARVDDLLSASREYLEMIEDGEDDDRPEVDRLHETIAELETAADALQAIWESIPYMEDDERRDGWYDLRITVAKE